MIHRLRYSTALCCIISTQLLHHLISSTQHRTSYQQVIYHQYYDRVCLVHSYKYTSKIADRTPRAEIPICFKKSFVRSDSGQPINISTLLLVMSDSGFIELFKVSICDTLKWLVNFVIVDTTFCWIQKWIQLSQKSLQRLINLLINYIRHLVQCQGHELILFIVRIIQSHDRLQFTHRE